MRTPSRICTSLTRSIFAMTSVYYMDVVNELEKMGDFMINVSQDLYKCKLKVS